MYSHKDMNMNKFVLLVKSSHYKIYLETGHLIENFVND